MTYDEFKAEYTKLFNLSFKYTVNQAGSSYYVQKLAELADAYPEFESRIENEACH
jgi:hypothetical protein